MSVNGPGPSQVPVSPSGAQSPSLAGADKAEATKSKGIRGRLRNFNPAKGAQKIGHRVSHLLDRKSSKSEAEGLRPVKPVTSNYKTKLEPPKDLEGRQKLNESAKLAALPYNQDIDKVNGSDSSNGKWRVDTVLTASLAAEAGLKVNKKGLIVDKSTGLAAMVTVNSEKNEIRLIFGGTTAGAHKGGLNKRMLLNGASTLQQWKANISNAVFGKIPQSYTQAKNLTDQLVKFQAQNAEYKDHTIVLSGHSKGAGEATYAALNREEPLKAECFCSAQLGSGMQKELPEESKKNAANYVTHYNIKGDLVPKLGNMRNGLGHIGNVVSLPAEHAWNSPVDRHDRFDRHIEHFTSRPIEAH